jgi:FkbM family methyltransferase
MGILEKIKSKLFKQDNYEIKRLISNWLPSNSPIIIEAGAHIGSDTCEMGKTWPSGTIHAFEPIPEIYTKLVKNTKHFKNIITYPVALGTQTGTAEIFVSSGGSDGSSSLLSPKEHISEHPEVQFNKSIMINTITLDEWALKNKIDRVDFAWLDMQGFELPVLKASQVILKTMSAIYTEVSLKEMYEGTVLYPEFKDWMKSNGFSVKAEDLRWNDMGNVLFVKD